MTYARLIKQLLIPSMLYFTSGSIAYSNEADLLDLSVEDLLNIEVTSVSKKAKSLNDSPAAVFVISQDDIRRIGATSIPEALRLAPGVDVARINANKWAVSVRGFNGRFANKLLVLIDGRNTYTQTFAGVFWENQDVMLEDVERIEVIRGSGATLWGANAVNGVINIITKHSADTQGGLLIAGGGTEEQGFGAFRYGGELNDRTTARVYVKGFNRDESTTTLGTGANDSWAKVQGGFRMDSQVTQQDSVTFQGDAYYSNINQYATEPQITPPYTNSFHENVENIGGNLLVRQQHSFSSTSEYTLQVFYDFYVRNSSFLKESRHALDIDFQHRFAWLDWNDIVWGLGYRYDHDDFQNSDVAQVIPTSRNDQLFSAFVQDEITLVNDHLWLTIGSKFEYNDYSDFEVQPTARIMWAPHHHHRLWGAISRAVRTPSRIEHDISLLETVLPAQPPLIPPTAIIIEGDRQYDAEEVISYELGYRTTLIDNVSIDLTAFYNNYSKLRSGDTGEPSFNGSLIEIPVRAGNNYAAQTYGFEIATVWQMLNWWRWDVNYSLLKMAFNSQEARVATGTSPQQRVSLRSSIAPIDNINLDVLFRYVDSSSITGVSESLIISDYVSLDIRLAWQLTKQVELSLVGQNLLTAHHLEYLEEFGSSAPIEIDRGVYGKLAWKF